MVMASLVNRDTVSTISEKEIFVFDEKFHALDSVVSEQDVLPSSVELDFRALLDGGFFGVEVTKLTTGRLVNVSSCDGIDMVIKILDLEPKDIAAEFLRSFSVERIEQGIRYVFELVRADVVVNIVTPSLDVANALATTYEASAENSLLKKTIDMRAKFEGQAYEVIKAFYQNVVQFYKGSGQALSVSKMKVARYPDFGLELLIPEHICINEILGKRDCVERIPSVVPTYCMENPEQSFVNYASSCTDEERDARLSKFEANFKQQQSELTTKIETVLKAITDRIVGTLPSDTVKNPKLGTHIVSSARSYPIIDPQCSSHPSTLITAIKAYFNDAIIKPQQIDEPEPTLDDEFKDLKDFINYHLPREWEISRDVEPNPFKDLIEKPIEWSKPPKNRNGAWHAKIRIIDPDGEEFTKTLQSIPTTRKLFEKGSPREIINLDHFYHP
uniref:Uncharacterized protein n=1 Tax=Tanacetum cinerariifolium TaxID=118510 RepID=A0A699GJ96_TANCI|nr:hypothetical protein [Tanacetum cinerariifolium]